MTVQNGGYEQDWSDDASHTAFRFNTDGSFHSEIEVGNIFTPSDGWFTFFKHGRPADFHDPDNHDGYVQPEVTHMAKPQYPDRVAEGEQSVKLFTFHQVHDAGLLQRVDNVTVGTTYRVSAKCHAWSNWHDGPHPSDPHWSEGAGYDAGYVLEGETNDDEWRNFTFTIGIDPTGGSNPYADSVVWGRGAHVYNEFVEISVEATAQSEYVTVFLRSVTLWRYKHNDAYWDDVRFGEVEGRVYDRYIHLIPQDATEAEWDHVQSIAMPRKQSVTQSVDDSVITHKNLRKRTVEVWDVDRIAGSADAFEEWVMKYYPPLPGILYSLLPDTGPDELVLIYPTTHMPPRITDGGEFGNDRGSYIHTGLDLASSWNVWGDEIICAFDGDVTFVGTHDREQGYGYQIKTMTEMADGRKVRVRYAHLVSDGAYVAEGDQVIAGQKLGKPNSTGNSTGDHLHIDVQVDGEYVDPEPLIDWPDDNGEPVERKTRGHISLHLQTMQAGWEEFTRDVKPSVVKVFSMHDVIGVKRASIDTAAVYRYFTNDYGAVFGAPTPEEGARVWISYFEDSLHEICDRLEQEVPGITWPYFYVESMNEVYATGDTDGLFASRDIEIAFCDVLQDVEPRVAPVVFCAAVGNPGEWEFDLLVPLARKCAQAEGMMGYHNYWWATQQDSGLTSWWPYHAGRWVEMDKVFVAQGVKVKWYGGESGAVGTLDDGQSLLPNDGWKSSKCYSGNWTRYLDDILECDAMIAEWNATHGDRYLGCVLFTSGTGIGWATFQIHNPEMQDLAAELIALYPL